MNIKENNLKDLDLKNRVELSDNQSLNYENQTFRNTYYDAYYMS